MKLTFPQILLAVTEVVGFMLGACAVIGLFLLAINYSTTIYTKAWRKHPLLVVPLALGYCAAVVLLISTVMWFIGIPAPTH